MMKVMLLVGVVLAIWLVHRLALWLETRGWLYYRRTRPSSSALGTAFLEAQQLVDPGKRFVLDATREDRSKRDDTGDPPDKAQ
jgi:ligand-binding sensor domain-containing protein